MEDRPPSSPAAASRVYAPGDRIDDYCARCRRLTDHDVVALSGDDVAQVRCRTCQNEHAYKGGKEPARRGKSAKIDLFNQVLQGILDGGAASGAPRKPRG